ncbi:LysR family transcriptional regulator [Actinomadura fibrosa]|uniref:LysR family transcriptional regulator n=1 Tax=Actinomadura fibrosa TaxID=111802 RepID=A0ABW2Y2T7_9ACTN|nr:LysR family transcriptional regulator [Actinomadura fibrosa]
MDLVTVRWFLAVADQGHVTNAAADLRISQPGLSRALARLERELDVPLFDRAGRGVVLTRYGELFAEHARRLVAGEEAARRALAEAADPERGEVSLAFLHTQGPSFVPDLIRRYRRDHPGVTFRLSQDRSERVAAMVLEGRADLAITSPRPDDPSLTWHPLVTERLQLAVPADHRLATRKRARVRDVLDEPFVAFREGAGLRAVAEDLFTQAGSRPEIAFEGDETSTVRGLVAAGLGVAVVAPLRPGEEFHGVRHIELAEPAAVRTIGLVRAAGRTRPPAAEAFGRFVEGRGDDLHGAGGAPN